LQEGERGVSEKEPRKRKKEPYKKQDGRKRGVSLEERGTRCRQLLDGKAGGGF